MQALITRLTGHALSSRCGFSIVCPRFALGRRDFTVTWTVIIESTMLAVIGRFVASAIIIIAWSAWELVAVRSAWRAVVACKASLCSNCRLSIIYSAIAEVASRALNAVVERLGVGEWSVCSWRTKWNA